MYHPETDNKMTTKVLKVVSNKCKTAAMRHKDTHSYYEKGQNNHTNTQSNFKETQINYTETQDG